MHELSLAHSIVETVQAAAQQANASRVEVVHLRLGVLAGVVADALLFGYEIAAAGTLLEGSRLDIESIPIQIFCPTCRQQVTLPTIQRFQCPQCGTFSADIRQGKELEIVSVEIVEASPAQQEL